MSTYTDLHNRVQESINVDYESRITPQQVKLYNKQNEYWGTFKGALEVDNIDITSGTLSNVTITDAILDNVTLRNAGQLTDAIDLGDYAKSDDVNELRDEVTNAKNVANLAKTAADNATTNAAAAMENINGVLQSVNAALAHTTEGIDGQIEPLTQQVNNAINLIDEKIASAKETLRSEFNTADSNLRISIASKADETSVVNRIQSEINDRRDADDELRESINAEKTARVEADAQFDGKFETQAAELRRQFENADNTVKNQIHDELDARSQEIAQEIDDEENTRIQEISRLDSRIDDEVETRERNDGTISAALTAEIETRSGEISRLDSEIATEATARSNADSLLQQSITNSVGAEAQARAEADNAISTNLTGLIADEARTRENKDSELCTALSGEIIDTRAALNSETANRVIWDTNLCAKINTVSSGYIAADNELSAAFSEELAQLNDALTNTKQNLLTTIAHDRHYELNADGGNVDNWPLIAKDMAVNVFDLTLADGKVVYYDGRANYDIAQLNVIADNRPDDFNIKIKTFAGIKNESILSTIRENTVYNLTNLNTAVPTGKGYNISYNDVNPNDPISALEIWLKPNISSYYPIYYGSAPVGKVYDAVLDDYGNIISGKYMFQVTNDSELSVFNFFDGITFNTTELSSCKKGTERVTYHLDVPEDGQPGTYGATFKLEKGIDNTRFVSIVDRHNPLDPIEFGRIYERIGSEDGTTIDENGVVQRIRVAALQPYNGTVYLYKTSRYNNYEFLTLVKADVPGENEKIYNYYLSATVVDESIDTLAPAKATFKLFKTAKLYNYEFTFNDLESDDDRQLTSYVTPLLYNTKITQAVDNPPLYVKVDLSHVPVWQDFKRPDYILERVAANNTMEWIYAEQKDDGSYIDIKYTISKLYIRYSTPENRETVFHEYSVSTEPSNDNGFDAETAEVVYESDEIDITAFEYNDGIPTNVYVAAVSQTPEEIDNATYQLSVNTTDNNVVKIQIPDKVQYSNEISREMLVAIRIKTVGTDAQTGESINKNVEVKFVNEDGNPIRFYNNKQHTLFLESNGWTTLQLNEIKPDRFLITDLNQNEDRLKFKQLFDIATEHGQQLDSLDARMTSAENDITYLSSMLSDAMRFKGDVLLKHDYNDADAAEIDEHCHLSSLIQTCAGIDDNTQLERGFTFRCVTADVDAQTYEFFDVADGNRLCLDYNDYIILKEDCALSDVNVDNVEIVKDFTNYIDRLSAASDQKYFILSNDNVATGDNTFEGTTNLSTAVVSNLTADNLTASQISSSTLSAAEQIVIDGKLTATADGLTADGKLSTNNDIDVAGNLSVGNESLSAKGIFADVNGISTATLKANQLSADSWASISAVADGQTTTLDDELTAIKQDVSTISVVVDDALSANCELPPHSIPDNAPLTAVVSKLLLVDEVTYDVYALTMRNGTLNVDKIGNWPDNHPHPHSI